MYSIIAYIVGFILYILATVFITWGNMDMGTWDSMDRGFWLLEGLVISFLAVILVQYNRFNK